jgi:hypothetical protein
MWRGSLPLAPWGNAPDEPLPFKLGGTGGADSSSASILRLGAPSRDMSSFQASSMAMRSSATGPVTGRLCMAQAGNSYS